MIKIIKNKYLSRAIRISLIFIAVITVLIFTFLQGMFYANRKATLNIAHDGTYQTWLSLKTMNDPEFKKLESLIDTRLDSYSCKLAEFLLEYPNYANRNHYNLLNKVKKYRQQYGRNKGNFSHYDHKTVDETINRTIKTLEDTHDMKTWGVFDINKLIKK